MKCFIPLLLVCLFAVSVPSHAQSMSKSRSYPRFALGVTGAYLTIEKGTDVTVTDVLAGSSADGKLQKGDVIAKAQGLTVAVQDPRVPLGRAIGIAEGGDGKLNLTINREGQSSDVTLTLDQLGRYSATWPLDCSKSDLIVHETAAYLATIQEDDGSYRFGKRKERDGLAGCLASLFLLSTDNARYADHVARHAKALAVAAEKRPTSSSWHLGYQGILLAEYYLKTGDKSVLAGLRSLCDRAVATQAAGAWGHGGIPNPGYVQSGLMNSAGVPVLTTLILARECGVEVDEAAFKSALRFFYRMAGHGNLCYGDHRSELWWPNTNGRNAMAACAFTLLDEAPYQKAAQHLAMIVADSYYKPEFGHTGGGFNVIWRGMGSSLIPETHRSTYQRQMNELAWYYDLCRQPEGGFSQLPTPPDTTRYTGLAWGTGAIGLTYTAPRKTLRITGAARTRHSVKTKPVGQEWGTIADDTFLAIDHAEGFGKETSPPDEVYSLLLGDKKEEATVSFCRKHLHHYNPLVRSWAARKLKEFNNAESIAVLIEASQHADPRVRRAAFDGVSGYDNWGRPMRTKFPAATVSKWFLPAILKTLNNPQSAWWEIDGALFALGRAEPSDIRSQMHIVDQFSTHEEWYLREGAFWSVVGLHKTITGPEFGKLTDMYARSVHVFPRTSYDAGFATILKRDKVALDRMWERKAGETLGGATHKPGVAQGYGTGGIHEAAHRTMMVLNHFKPTVFESMVPDFVEYLKLWEPYYQHSVWLMSGSKWQPGILKVLEGLDEAESQPIRAQLERILKDYSNFDTKRIGRDARDLPEKIKAALN